MKQIIFLIIAVAAGLNAYSQQKTMRNTKDEPKKLFIQNENSPLVKLPDLTIDSLSITNLGREEVDGVIKYAIQVSFTVRNIGNVAVAADKLGVQGWIGYDRTDLKMKAAGGIALSIQATEMINPGGILRRSFKSRIAFNNHDQLIYSLFIEKSITVKEFNEENNMAQLILQF
jgi:hypothetical protein